MKNLAILAVTLGVLSGTAIAESAVSVSPPLTLALNSTAAMTWIEPATAIDTDIITKEIEQEVANTIEKVSIALDKQLENKIAKELEYAMQ